MDVPENFEKTGAQRQSAKSPPIAKPPQVAGEQRAEPFEDTTVTGEVLELSSHLVHSPRRWKVLTLVVGVIVVLLLNIVGQIYLNRWQRSFFDAIEKKNLGLIGQELLVFLVIIAVLLTIVVSQTWLHEMLKVRLREWLTHHLLDLWFPAGRAYRLGISEELGVNPDQRIQEDTRNLSEMSADLGIGFLQAALLLVSFVGVLWGMSQNITFTSLGVTVAIPGYMVWAALGYAALGSWLTWLVGRPLIRLNAQRYAREADLRFSLVRVSESAESIALYAGEPDERRITNRYVDRVISVARQMSVALSQLVWITSGYGWLAIVVPILVALPGYLHGTLTLGGLMMVVGAFNQVQTSLKWFVDNFPRAADWRAALHRVTAFHDALLMVDERDEEPSIKLKPHPEGHLVFERVSVWLADGGVVISEATTDIEPGERVLVVGESGTGKSTLLRAIGGLWPWGTGTIYLPPREQMMFLPQRPYMPLGTLRQAVTYPAHVERFTDDQIKGALIRVGLPEFVNRVDDDERWDRLMSLGQQQRLAFARVLLHQPKWVFLDEATAALDEENQQRVMSIFDEELPETSIFSIGHRPGLEAFHRRTLHLIGGPAGARLRRNKMEPPSHTHRLRDFMRQVLREMHLTSRKDKDTAGPAPAAEAVQPDDVEAGPPERPSKAKEAEDTMARVE
jgi:vitamin B12/bleomycin/antimicrobial peptide transport system ATP-binding/permease protein